MSALAAISLINGIIQLAPSITSLFKGSEKNVQAAELAAKIARNVTGTITNEDALTSLTQNPEQLLAYERELRAHEKELETILVEDKKSARERDAEFIRAGVRNIRADILTAVAVIYLFTVTFVVIFVPDVNEYAKGVLTALSGLFVQQLANIFAFEFGTTRKSEESNQRLINDYISIPSASQK